MAPISAFASHLTALGYHPRSNKHSNFLCETILSDLLSNCPSIARHAATGQLVADLNFTILAGATEWNIDLVLGAPPGPPTAPPAGTLIKRERPSLIRVGVEAKAVMTEHRKASRNRQRDLDAFHGHLHNYSPDAVAGGVVLLNIAPAFTSPLRNKVTTCTKCAHVFTPSIVTVHGAPADLVKFGIGLFRQLPVRSSQTAPGLEALSVIVVNHTNAPGSTATIHTKAPAPPIGDPLHYEAFLQKICHHYATRWP